MRGDRHHTQVHILVKPLIHPGHQFDIYMQALKPWRIAPITHVDGRGLECSAVVHGGVLGLEAPDLVAHEEVVRGWLTGLALCSRAGGSA